MVRGAGARAGHPRALHSGYGAPDRRAFGAARCAGDAGATAGDASLGRATLTLVLCFAFAAGMVGHGLPFGMAAAIYLFLHIFLLELPERRARGEVARGALVAGAVAVGVATTVTLVFQELFLVRLP